MQSKNLKNLSLAVLAAMSIAACTPMVKTSGNMLPESKVSKIQPAISSRAEVSQIWGPPTTVAPFDPNVWYYIGETTEQKGVFEPEVAKRQMIRVTFGTDELVSELAALDPKNGKELAIVDRRTPTAGKEFTVFQQFIGNLGKFNSDDVKK